MPIPRQMFTLHCAGVLGIHKHLGLVPSGRATLSSQIGLSEFGAADFGASLMVIVTS